MTALPSQVLVWKFGNASGNLMSQPAYEHNKGIYLQCTTTNKYLTWGKQPIGINLVWHDQPNDRKLHFTTKDRKVREILTGEPVALGIGGGESFLYYKERSLGINLGWSQEPDFEWRIYGPSGKKGERIAAGTAYGLMNVEVKPHADFMIHFDRKPGMCDIGWTTSPTTLGTAVDIGVAIGKLVPALL